MYLSISQEAVTLDKRSALECVVQWSLTSLHTQSTSNMKRATVYLFRKIRDCIILEKKVLECQLSVNVFDHLRV